MWATLLQLKINCYLKLKDFDNAKDIWAYLYKCVDSDKATERLLVLWGHIDALRQYDLQIDYPLYTLLPTLRMLVQCHYVPLIAGTNIRRGITIGSKSYQ